MRAPCSRAISSRLCIYSAYFTASSPGGIAGSIRVFYLGIPGSLDSALGIMVRIADMCITDTDRSALAQRTAEVQGTLPDLALA